MQIPMGSNRRVDFYGNAKDGVHVEMVNDKGETFVSRRLSEEQRLKLIETLMRLNDGKAV